ncbi:MAG: hypothetical protein DRP20_05445 [Thermotogae bacterium]|nr:MAG: hypothetical protein DRP20_05445 [Thermotogota bacterium]
MSQFEKWQKFHPNFVTSELVKYKEIGEYVVELSKGEGFVGEEVFGVTALKREDNRYFSVHDLSKLFFDREAAEKYFQDLQVAIQRCRGFKEDVFVGCVEKMLSER